MPDSIEDDVDLVDGPIDADLWGYVSRQTPRSDPGFALSIGRHIGGSKGGEDAASGVRSSVFTEAACDFAASRYDVDDYEDGTPVGILLMDTDTYDAVFAGLGDIVAVEDDPTEAPSKGKITVIGRSGETVRVQGVGAVDVEPPQIVEVTDRVEYHE